MKQKKPDIPSCGWNRRQFLKIAGITGAGAFTRVPGTLAAEYCMDAVNAEQETMARFMDTLIPQEDDPDAPGLLDTCCLNFVYDPFYPIANLVPIIVFALDAASLIFFNKRFKDLDSLTDRELLVGNILGAIPLGTAVAILKSPFFTDMYTTSGWTYVGFPGPSLGYPDSSCRKSFIEDRRAPKGNLP